MPLVIKWNKQALKQFDYAIDYIVNDSPANAEKFKRDTLNKIDVLLKFPLKYSADNYNHEIPPCLCILSAYALRHGVSIL